MLENDLKFLEETFKQYYFDHFDLVIKNLILE